MRFLHPEVLYFLFLLLIPIIVHLFNFRRYKTLYFSNVRFLKDVQNKTKPHSRLKNILILISRLLAFSFLILAFARPYFPTAENSSTGRKYVSIYVDNSFSMDGENEDGNLFELSRQYALILLEEFGEADRFFIHSNELSSNGLRAVQKEQAVELLGNLELSSLRRNLKEIHDRQLLAFESYTDGDHLSFWISDFQENLFDESFETDTTIIYRIIPVQSVSQANLSLDSVWFNDPVRRPAALEELSFRIVNHGDQDVEAVQVSYIENGLTKTVIPVDVPVNSRKIFSLGYTGPDSGSVQAHLEIDDYPVQFDDRLYLNYSIKTGREVLLIQTPGFSPELNKLYKDAQFLVEEQDLLSMDYSALGSYDLIVLNDNGPFGSGFIDQIKAYVEDGGSFLIVPQENIDPSNYADLCSALGLPGLQGVQSEQMNLADLYQESELLKGVFKRIPNRLDLPVTEQHYGLNSSTSSYHISLLSMDNGSPFWAYSKLGRGMAHIQAVPFSSNWSNWTSHALFPVIMFQLAYITDKQELYYTLGEQDRIRFDRPLNWENNDLPLELIDDQSSYYLSEQRQIRNEIELGLAGLPEYSGQYVLRKEERNILNLSFNYSSKEGDLRFLDQAALESWMMDHGIDKDNLIRSRADNIRAVLGGLEFSGGWWKWCILISLLFLFAEIILLKVLRP